ncbi:MAG: hypothetical protein CVT48_00940 [Thermoplasmata archaeon HGW-Thermoplasmata-1]|nr:MAG: hypothetical protein CVT48_00940 [Thermoplasmata archaeon HGW-Thermoplasmata-1]
MSLVMREVLEEMGYEFERGHSQKYGTRTMFVMPVPTTSYVFRFTVKKPAEFVIDLYDLQLTQSAFVPHIEIPDITSANINAVRAVLKNLAGRLPRKPWHFTFGQRLAIGLLNPEFHRAKKAWRRLGFPT